MGESSLIIKERLQECLTLFSFALKGASDEKVLVGDTEYNRNELVTFTTKWMYKVMVEDEQKTEMYFDFFIESIQYFLGLTNELPKTVHVTEQELEKINNNYHDEAKFTIKTK